MKEIVLPEGFEVDRIEDNKIILRESRKLPASWEEFCRTHPVATGEHAITTHSTIGTRLNKLKRDAVTDRNLIPTEQNAKSILALMQLIQLRDCYRQGWKPDWKNSDEEKYVIVAINNKLMVEPGFVNAKVFTFQSEEIAELFLKNFKDLIEEYYKLT